MMRPVTQDHHRREVRAWCLYDWANSAFATTVMAAMYPPFFRSLAIAGGLSESQATAAWGYIAAFALLVVTLAAPILGAVSDHAGRRKLFLSLFAGLGIVATTCFVLNGDDTWRLAAFLFVLGQIGFSGANIFYEALLPSIANHDSMDRVSSQGYALGYLGGGILLVVNTFWVLKPEWFAMPGAAFAVRASFVSVAVWWAVFTIPLLRRVAEPPASGRAGELSFGAGFKRLRATFREVRRYRHLALFLVAFWFYNDGISTIMKMATAYGDEIGIGLEHLIGALVLTQFVGFPCALLFGRFGERIGAKRAVLLGIGVYTAICLGGYFMRTPMHFYLLAGLVGTVQGGTQALSRSLFASMVPRHKTAEMFGFFSTSAKFAGIIGPLLFGVVSQVTGESRLSIVALVILFVLGAAILWRVDVDAGIRAAQETFSPQSSKEKA